MALSLIGLFNIVGSIGAGWLGRRQRMKWLLTAIHASRAVMIFIHVLSPPTPITFMPFAIGLGMSWLASVPPTAGLVGALFGAWLGGVAVAKTGSDLWVWYADMAPVLPAAASNLPIREARLPDRVPVAAQ